MNNLVNSILPSYCILCKRVGHPICSSCFKYKIISNWDTYCCVCNTRVKRGLLHEECKNETYLDGHFFITPYDEAPKRLVMEGKYSFNYSNFEFIGRLMNKFLKLYKLDPQTVVCPIPLSKRKKRVRGFNQSEILASQIKSLDMKSLLVKLKDSNSQVTLNGEERRQNLMGLFTINNKITIEKDRPVLLIDDVFTTGSTLNEAAKVLKSAGFKTVFGYTFAKAGQI